MSLSRKPTMYLAGAVEDADDDGEGWRASMERRYSGIQFKNPLDVDQNQTPEELVAEEKQMIEESDVVYLRYDHSLRHWGTAMELMFAYERMIPVVVETVNVDRERDLPFWLRAHASSLHVNQSGALGQAIRYVAGFPTPEDEAV